MEEWKYLAQESSAILSFLNDDAIACIFFSFCFFFSFFFSISQPQFHVFSPSSLSFFLFIYSLLFDPFIQDNNSWARMPGALPFQSACTHLSPRDAFQISPDMHRHYRDIFTRYLPPTSRSYPLAWNGWAFACAVTSPLLPISIQIPAKFSRNSHRFARCSPDPHSPIRHVFGRDR